MGDAQVLNESSCKGGVRRGLQNHSLHGPPGPNMTPISPHTLEEGQRDHRQSPNQPLDTARDPCGKQPQVFISRNSAQHTMQTLLSTSCWDPHKHWWALRQHPEIVLPSMFLWPGKPEVIPELATRGQTCSTASSV